MSRAQRIGDYDLGVLLGKGSVGVVYAARHRGTGAHVAVKLLTWRGASDPVFRAVFLAEARAAAALDHPRVVRLLDQGVLGEEEAARAGFPADAPYLVMERVRGGPVRPFKGDEGAAALKQVLGDLLAALAHLHARGLVHRDIKAGNLLVDERSGRAQLTDFSVVQHLDEAGLLRFEGMRAGTPEYMAPEQARGETRAMGPWTDLYAVGCLAWMLSTGSPPFTDKDAKVVIQQQLSMSPPPFVPRLPLPAGFEGWLRRLLRKHPGRRFPLAADAKWALDEVFEGEVVPPPGRAPPVPRTWRDTSNAPKPWRWRAGTGLALYGLRETPFVGREGERDRLWAELEAVSVEGEPRVIALRGPSGCGKSRLLAWLGRRAEELGVARPVRARHSPDGGPQDGLRGALAEHLCAHGLPAERVLAHVSRQLAREGATQQKEWIAVAAVLAPEAHPEAAMAPQEQGWLLLHRALRRVSRGRAALLLLDDVHWSAESLALCAWLLERAMPIPLLVVLTVDDEVLAERPVEAEAFERLLRAPRSAPMPLRPLGEEAHHALVRQLVHLEPALARAVGGATRGFPAFAVQLVGEWIEEGLLRPGPRGLTLPPGVVPALPDSMRAVWTGRVGRALAKLDPQDQRAVGLAAALGLQVDAGEWLDAAAALELTPSAAALEVLLQHALAEPTPGGWRWMHGVARERAYASAAGSAPELHRACATMLESRVGPGVSRRRARHLIAAGDPVAAIQPLCDAAADLLAQKQPARAGRVLAKAQAIGAGEVPERDVRWATISRLYAQVELLSERFEQVYGHLDHAEAIYEEQRDRRGLLRVVDDRRWALNAQGRMEEAAAALERAERALVGLDDPFLRGLLELSWAGHASSGGDFEGAVRHARRGLELLAGEPGESAEQYRATLSGRLSASLISLKRVDEAEAPLRTYTQYWEQRRFKTVDVLTLRAEHARVAGRLDEAYANFQGALDHASELGMPPYHRALPAFNQGLIALERAQFERASERFTLAEAGFAEGRRALLMGLSWLGRAACAAELGLWESWHEQLDGAEGLLGPLESTLPEVVELLERSLRAARRAGQEEAAERARAFALRQAARLGDEARVERLRAL